MDISDLVQMMQKWFAGITVLEDYSHCGARCADSEATADPSRHTWIKLIQTIFYSGPTHSALGVFVIQ